MNDAAMVFEQHQVTMIAVGLYNHEGGGWVYAMPKTIPKDRQLMDRCIQTAHSVRAAEIASY